MTAARKQRIEFGDFQTPDSLALDVCQRLTRLGIRPSSVIEPTCGVGAFLVAASQVFSAKTQLFGFEINKSYIATLNDRLGGVANRAHTEQADFFATDWQARLEKIPGDVLVLGNFPWVTNATQGTIGGENLPEKTNFLGFNGFDAISGKANFDISEWMLIEVIRWFSSRNGALAMLVKTATARKVLAHAERQQSPVCDASIFNIDAKKHFQAAVDACLLVMKFSQTEANSYDYTVYDSLNDTKGRRVGHRQGMTVGDLVAFENFSPLFGTSPQKWRSGVKHDASAVMEFTRVSGGYLNGLGETVQLEDSYLYPLLKGSDIGSGKDWREKFTLVTQRFVGEDTGTIQAVAPKTWRYLLQHAAQLDARGSVIYQKNPRFSIFGVGEYAFRPWKIAICGLYKALRFRFIGPIEGRPAMFDDTVYFLSFETEKEARETLDKLNSREATGLLSSLIFWDEKRPIKTSILNNLDWTRVAAMRVAEGQGVA